MIGRTLLAASLALSTALAASVHTCDIENGFDIVGQDIKNVPGNYTTCCDACIGTDKCVAWSWSALNGGTCWLKNGTDQIITNVNVKSSRVIWEAPNACRHYDDVDFVGNDIGNTPGKDVGACCDICRTTTGCRAYSWSDYQGGTCWLKSSQDRAIFKRGVKSAHAYQIGAPFYSDVYAMVQGVDFVDHDLGSKHARDPYDCGKICSDFNGTTPCKAYSWSDYNDGTCWLKYTKNETVVNTGVTSGYLVHYV